MKIASRLWLRTALAAAVAVAAAQSAMAQPDPPLGTGKASTLLEAVADSLTQLGKKTQEMVWPRLPPITTLDSVDPSKVRFIRTEEETFPLGPAPRITIEHADGEIRVGTWDAPVVRLEAEITAGGEDQETAQKVAAAVQIETLHQDSSLEIRTIYPNTQGVGPVTRFVDYTLTIPVSSKLECVNSFGDTIVRDVAGEVSVDAQFGEVDLGHLQGPVRARVRGDWPVRVRDVPQGGVFVLWGVQAEFSGVGGGLDISSLLGSVTLRDLAPGVNARIVSESGPVRVEVDSPGPPSVDVEVLFGQLESNLDVPQTQRGNRRYMRRQARESAGSISVLAFFSDVSILEPRLAPVELEEAAPKGVLAKDEVAWQAPAAGGPAAVVRIEAPGTLELVGTDEEAMEAVATRTVRVEQTELARMGLDNLALRGVEGPGGMVLLAQGAEDAAGVIEARMDLVVRMPREQPIRIESTEAQVSVRGMVAPIEVVCESADIHVERCRGSVTLTTGLGSIEVIEAAGDVSANAEKGNVTTRRVSGGQVITCAGGKTVIDSPRATVEVHQKDGDVRIMPLDGVQGDYQVESSNGNISMLIPEGTDARVVANARGGTVRPAFPLAGEVGRDYARLQGVPAPGVAGTYSITLSTVDGDIIID